MHKPSLRAILAIGLLVFLAACSETTSDGPANDGDVTTDGDRTEQDAAESETATDGDTAEREAELTTDGDTADGDSADGDSSDGDSAESEEADSDPLAEREESVACLGAISIADLHDILTAGTKDFLLINVHVPDQGEITGTDTHISYQDNAALTAYIGPDLHTKVVVYCMSNYMSMIAGEALVGQGYTAIRYLDGGMSGWQGAGYALVNVPARKTP